MLCRSVPALTRVPLICGIAIAGASALPASADAWQGNTFQSPNGNVICQFTGRFIACGSYASEKIVLMSFYSRPLKGRVMPQPSVQPHTLANLMWWNASDPAGGTGKIRCRSFPRYMFCKNATGWSFRIGRSFLQVFHRGTLYATL
jgi:hypothetical protein